MKRAYDSGCKIVKCPWDLGAFRQLCLWPSSGTQTYVHSQIPTFQTKLDLDETLHHGL